MNNKPMTAAAIACKLRKDICAYALASTGVTANMTSDQFSVSKTCARQHLIGLEILGHLRQGAQVQPKTKGMTAVFYPSGYFIPAAVVFAVIKPKVAKLDDESDFRGTHAVKAVQLGMQRDPMVAALFGARSAA